MFHVCNNIPFQNEKLDIQRKTEHLLIGHINWWNIDISLKNGKVRNIFFNVGYSISYFISCGHMHIVISNIMKYSKDYGLTCLLCLNAGAVFMH